jgi:hypothetical protein
VGTSEISTIAMKTEDKAATQAVAVELKERTLKEVERYDR